MKTLVNIFVLLVLFSFSAFSQQQVQSAGDWILTGVYGYIDSTQTMSYETTTGSQVFKSYGITSNPIGSWIVQTTWSKEFKNLLTPDTIAIDCKFLKGVNNRITTCIFLSVQESPLGKYYGLGKYQPISNSSDWQRFTWDMSAVRDFGIKTIYRIYLSPAAEAVDSTYTGFEVELKNLDGIDSTGVKTYIDLGTIATGVPDGVSEVKQTPKGFELSQNYPNPFNPTTTINYTIANSDKVKLAVYSLLGTEVAVLVDEAQSAGLHTARFNAHNLASGVYFYKLQAGNQVITKKMMLLK